MSDFPRNFPVIMLFKPSERHKKGVRDSRQTLPSEGYIIVVLSKRLQNYEYFRRLQEAKLFLTLTMHLYDLAKMENLIDGVSKEFRRLMRDVCYLNQCRISLFGIAYRQ